MQRKPTFSDVLSEVLLKENTKAVSEIESEKISEEISDNTAEDTSIDADKDTAEAESEESKNDVPIEVFETPIIQPITKSGFRRKHLKRNKRKRIAFRVLILFMIIGGLGYGGYRLTKGILDGTFEVKHIAVVGNEVVDSNSIREAARIPVHTSIFLIDLNEVYRNVVEHINCQHLMITKKFPDTVVINIEEQAAFCAVMNADKFFYLDYDFKVVESSPTLGRADLPILSGLTGAWDAKVGSVIDFQPAFRATELKTIMTIIANSGYKDRISEYIAADGGVYRIITKNNVEFIVSDLDNFKENYNYIGTILEKNKSSLIIDLTMGSQPIVKKQ